ncbi:winged helix-turn-helix domain-containing protein [Vibrio fluvialis]|uniref:winged helix-turn-helix domain-containing protein n=1 Tax=Vibrio fluvialis TaxID=676 RepID=UPI00193AEF52|nr:winged helix-turn-helix domain-containing protein [Vibrio fluvialis]MBY8020966.1 winged helix-turn-helix domain-containing protein [Vibrio fluvialis]MBY8276175.1 winged helix-turn-helix domain-containing protein [Vibrio fluvialis]
METPNEKVVINSRFLFDVVERSLTDAYDEKIIIGTNEAQILSLLVNHPNSVLSREEIYRQVWTERGGKVDDSSLTQSISLLRKMLGDKATKPEYIKTESRIGYRFIAPVDPLYSEIPLDDLVETSREEGAESVKLNGEAQFGHRYINTKHDPVDENARCEDSKHRLSQLVTPIMAVLLTSLLLIDFNGSQGMLSYLYRSILE